MSSSAADLAPTPARAAGAARSDGVATLAMLARRELWEHRGLWLAPLVVAGLLVLCSFGVWRGDVTVLLLLPRMQWLPLAAAYGGVSALLYLVMGIVVSVYLIDCLYAERKDRSILFWKSMPVSDGLTVTSKFLVAGVLVPLAVYLLAVLTGLLITGIYELRIAASQLTTAPTWDLLTWVRIQVVMLLTLIASLLWYAPVSAYLMLVSAWARRSVYLWALLPPVLAPIFERIVFGTHYIYGFLVYRVAGIGRLLDIRHADVIGGHVHMRPITWTGERSFGAVFTSSTRPPPDCSGTPRGGGTTGLPRVARRQPWSRK